MQSALSPDVESFVQEHLDSLWALELFLKMAGDPAKSWSADHLVLELRANNRLVAALLEQFRRGGLVSCSGAGAWQWAPNRPEVAVVARKLVDTYAVTPFAVIKTIAEAPENRLKQFADAFLLRKE